MTAISVHGDMENGDYSVVCTCGIYWSGTIKEDATGWREPWSVLVPVIRHRGVAHPNEQIHVHWNPTFAAWLRSGFAVRGGFLVPAEFAKDWL